jgi:hypothetical protein
MTNRHKPHVVVLPVVVLPEDDADHELATGFELESDTRQLQVLPYADGWLKTLDAVEIDHSADMRRWPTRHLILVIDFDDNADRITYAKTKIPDDLKERVYVIGSLSDPQKLRSSIGRDLESIGRGLADDCRNDTNATWNHPLLQHNAAELDRLRNQVRPILFPLTH